MTYNHSIRSSGNETAALRVPEFEVDDAPPPPAAASPRVTADFAASAAMAKDILALSADDDGVMVPPVPPPPPTAVAAAPGPQPVPDLHGLSGPPDWSDAPPIAADFYFTSSGSKAKKRLWKVAR